MRSNDEFNNFLPINTPPNRNIKLKSIQNEHLGKKGHMKIMKKHKTDRNLLALLIVPALVIAPS